MATCPFKIYGHKKFTFCLFYGIIAQFNRLILDSMTTILRRLLSSGMTIPSFLEEGTTTWIFPQKIEEHDLYFFRELVKHHLFFNEAYNIHCTQLAHDSLRKDKKKLIQQLVDALMMARLLEHLYGYYLNVPREVVRFRDEQKVYRGWLAEQGYLFPENGPSDGPSGSLDAYDTRFVRTFTGTINIPRNLIGRTRRLLALIVPVAVDFDRYRIWVGRMNQLALPILNYASWICFIPRTITNLFLMAKHVIPGAWMSEQERSLGWQTRLGADILRRWFELANDIAWLLLGLLNCFVFIGALAPLSFYGALVLLAYDVVLACVRAYIEISRLEALATQYIMMLDENDLSSADQEQINGYLEDLQQRLSFEHKRQCVMVINTIILFLAFSLACPVFAFNPIMPMIGAILAVLATIVCYAAGRWLDQQNPAAHLAPVPVQEKQLAIVPAASVIPNSLFKPPAVRVMNYPIMDNSLPAVPIKAI